MFAPAHACKALYNVNNTLRLAWVGNETGSGDFAVIQLCPEHEVGTPHDARTPGEFWFGTVDGDRIHRGTLFSRNGDLKRDWEPWQVPIVVALMNEEYEYADGTKINIADVFSGKFLKAIRYWLTDRKERILSSKTALNKDMQFMVDDSMAELADAWKWEMNQTGAERFGHIARKHSKEAGAYKMYDRDKKDWVR